MTAVAPFCNAGPHAPDHPEVRATRASTECVLDSTTTLLPAKLFLTPLQFALIWIVVLALRLACILYLLAFSFASLALAAPQMEYYASLLAPSSLSVLLATWWSANAIALAHFYKIARAVVHSIQAKELSFYGRQTRSRTGKHIQRARTRFQMRVPCATKHFSWLFGRKGFFGVESRHFETVFLARELLEMVSQSVQAYNSSMLIARHWLNTLFVAVVFVNSFSTPTVQHFNKRSQAHKRLACLTADLALDAMTSMVIPLIVIVPYARAFDFSRFTIDSVILYDVPQYVGLVMEMRQVFTRNVLDLLTTIVPHLSIFSCLGGIQALLQPMRRIESLNPISQIPSAIDLKPSALKHTLRHVKLRVVIHVAFFVWGCAIVVIHLAATLPSYQVEDPGCKLLYRPWFSTTYSCSVYEYNCYRQDVASPPKDSFLTFLDANRLSALIFSHCSELIVPIAVQRFHNLVGFEIWNSTIASWSMDAGLTQTNHPVMTYVCLVGVNMTGIPDGLLFDLPHDLYDIEIAKSNLSSVPDDLDKRWKRVGVVFIEHSQLTSVPDALWRMEISELSLIGNRITNFPSSANAIAGGRYFHLSVGGNPISSLPENIGDISNLDFVMLERTQIRVLPTWISRVEASIYLRDTPFCEVKSATELEHAFYTHAVITCTESYPNTDGCYPLAKMQALQAP